MGYTHHYINDNKSRVEFIKNHIGIGNKVDTFYWDKGHPNGAEYHTITDTGIIIVRNARTMKVVTILIARPQQIKRYYIANNQPIPFNVVQVAYEHQLKGYNKM